MSKKKIHIDTVGSTKKGSDEQYRNVQEQLHSDKDSAINSLWQRSILLVSLLVICYTGYGTLFMKMLDDDVSKKYSLKIPQNLVNNDEIPTYVDVLITDATDYKIWRIHAALSIISIVGCILSMLWILMAKGSKAWQEAHENAISDLEYFNIYKNLPYDGELGEWKIRMKSYSHGWWQGGYLWLDSENVNDCIFSTKAGCYSPSKINIMIGIVSFIVFIALFLCHTIMILLNTTNILVGGIILLACMAVLFIIYVIIHYSTKSSSLCTKVVKKDSKRDKRHIEFTDTIEKLITNGRKKQNN